MGRERVKHTAVAKVFNDANHSSLKLPLRQRLILAQVTSAFDSNQLYVPDDVVRRVADEEDVESELRCQSLKSTKQFKDFIMKEGKRIFLILVHIRLTQKIQLFFEHEFGDRHLPIEYDDCTGDIITAGQLSEKQVSIFNSLLPNEICEFCDIQWRFTAPVFSYRNRYDRVLPCRTILPFNIESRPKGTPFSKVWKVSMYQDHMRMNVMDDGSFAYLALKEVAGDVDQVREQIKVSECMDERKTLRTITKGLRSYVGGPNETAAMHHLTQLQASFQRGQKVYMLFDWADGGNLYGLWYKYNPPKDEALLLCLKQQVGGLLGALQILHSLNCRHGDLKPDNILVFESLHNPESMLGTLKIADFGLARIHETATQHRTQQTAAMSGAQRYEPPEVNKYNPHRVEPWSRRYDVWSLGCIFLELIVWVCHGHKGLKEFNDRLGDRRVEKFWKYDRKNHPQVQVAVIKTFQRLKAVLMGKATEKMIGRDKQKQQELQDYLLKVLNKVETRMLKTKTTNEEEDTGGCRATSKALLEEFNSEKLLDLAYTPYGKSKAASERDKAERERTRQSKTDQEERK